MQLSKKEKKRLEQQQAETKAVGLQPEGRVAKEKMREPEKEEVVEVEIPKEGVVCG